MSNKYLSSVPYQLKLLLAQLSLALLFLSCHVRVSAWIHTLKLPECQGTSCSNQARNLKVKWLLIDG